MIRINNDWEYIDQWNDSFIVEGTADKVVRLPHTVQEIPLHYAVLIVGNRRAVVHGQMGDWAFGDGHSYFLCEVVIG